MSDELAAAYATVDKNKDKSSQELHQETVRDIYAVVNKSKKIRKRQVFSLTGFISCICCIGPY